MKVLYLYQQPEAVFGDSHWWVEMSHWVPLSNILLLFLIYKHSRPHLLLFNHPVYGKLTDLPFYLLHSDFHIQ